MLGHEGRKCRTEIRLHGFVNTQNGQIHTWQAPVILRVIIPVHGRFIRITIFIGRRVICLQPRIDILSLLLSLFFHGNNCQNVLIFLSLFFFYQLASNTALPLLIIKINRRNMLYRSMFFPIWNEIKKEEKKKMIYDNFQVDYFYLEARGKKREKFLFYLNKSKNYRIIVSLKKIYSLFTC